MLRELEVEAGDQGQRADVFVTAQLAPLSRSQVQRLFAEGKVLSADGTTLKAADKIKAAVRVDLSRPPKQPVDIPILYQDNDVVVINKPVGLLSHAKGAASNEFTVADFVKPLTSDQSPGRAGIVHRLDRATSGVMIVACTPEARIFLQKQFAKRRVKKTYSAIVEGELDPPKQRLEWPIVRNPKKPNIFRVGANGKPATTIVAQDVRLAIGNRLLLQPQTGRTHQLRVHLAHAGQPIIGDTLYHGKPASRLMLHAWKLELQLPGALQKSFEAPLPKEFID